MVIIKCDIPRTDFNTPAIQKYILKIEGRMIVYTDFPGSAQQWDWSIVFARGFCAALNMCFDINCSAIPVF